MNEPTPSDTPETDEAQDQVWTGEGGWLDYIEPDFARTLERERDTARAQLGEARETVRAYATTARVIALHLKEFCDKSLPYDEMIADAARKAAAKLSEQPASKQKAEAPIPRSIEELARVSMDHHE